MSSNPSQMRFQQALLLQKQQVEQEERQEHTQQLLERIYGKIEAEYEQNKKLFDPLGRSLARIQAYHRSHPVPESTGGSSSSLNVISEQSREEVSQQDNFIKKQVVGRNLRDAENTNALKMYRQLRFSKQ